MLRAHLNHYIKISEIDSMFGIYNGSPIFNTIVMVTKNVIYCKRKTCGFLNSQVKKSALAKWNEKNIGLFPTIQSKKYKEMGMHRQGFVKT